MIGLVTVNTRPISYFDSTYVSNYYHNYKKTLDRLINIS